MTTLNKNTHKMSNTSSSQVPNLTDTEVALLQQKLSLFEELFGSSTAATDPLVWSIFQGVITELKLILLTHRIRAKASIMQSILSPENWRAVKRQEVMEFFGSPTPSVRLTNTYKYCGPFSLKISYPNLLLANGFDWLLVFDSLKIEGVRVQIEPIIDERIGEYTTKGALVLDKDMMSANGITATGQNGPFTKDVLTTSKVGRKTTTWFMNVNSSCWLSGDAARADIARFDLSALKEIVTGRDIMMSGICTFGMQLTFGFS